ncbi:hypothetical protein CA850_09625 [Micromonospora echinospora]|nr:hypothetical protein CA850_09625 [Micromonospora echinospora]
MGAGAAVTLAAVAAVPVLADSAPPTTPAAVTPPTRCVAELLPLPGRATYGTVLAGDPTGRYLAGRTNGTTDTMWGTQSVIWVDGRVQRMPAPVRDMWPRDVTSSGQVVGVADGGAYLYQADPVDRGASSEPAGGPGKVRRLLGGVGRQPVAINEAGRIAGELQVTAGNRGTRSVPILWASPTSEPVDLPLPGSDWQGHVRDIGDDGTVVGTVSDGFAPDHARGYLWRADGTGEFLPLPQMRDGPATAFWPVSVRGSWVVGTARRALSDTVQEEVVRLDLTTGTFAPLPQPAEFQPTAGNAQGWAVGQVDGTSGNGRVGLLTDTGLLDLPEPEHQAERYDPRVSVVSDDARTIGGTQTVRRDRDPLQVASALSLVDHRPVRWTCR